MVDERKYKETKYKDYLVSKNGDIYSLKTNKKLKKRIDSDGYQEVLLTINNKPVSKTVHRIVAETWIPNPDNKPIVNHKNGNRKDNRAENLEWVTSSENNLGKNQKRKHHYNI